MTDHFFLILLKTLNVFLKSLLNLKNCHYSSALNCYVIKASLSLIY